MGILSALFGIRDDAPPAPVEAFSAAHGALADAAYSYAMQPAVEAESIAGIKDAARREGVRVPVQYRMRNRDDSLTKQIRGACVGECSEMIRAGDIGYSWEGDFVPRATTRCTAVVKPIIAGAFPLIGMVVWNLIGSFVAWLIAKIIWHFIRGVLERMFPGAVHEAPGTVVAGFAMREGIQ